MNKQFLRKITMLSVLLTLATISINGQALSESKIVVNIPFDFAVGETNLPAGNYTVRRIALTSSYDQLLIQSADGRSNTHIGITRPNRASEVQKQSKLVFNRYGDQYFLSQVWMAGSDTGRDLFQSRSERSLAKEVVRSKRKSQQLTLTARKQ